MRVTGICEQQVIRGPSRRAFLTGTLAAMQVMMISRLSLAQTGAPLPALVAVPWEPTTSSPCRRD